MNVDIHCWRAVSARLCCSDKQSQSLNVFTVKGQFLTPTVCPFLRVAQGPRMIESLVNSCFHDPRGWNREVHEVNCTLALKVSFWCNTCYDFLTLQHSQREYLYLRSTLMTPNLLHHIHHEHLLTSSAIHVTCLKFKILKPGMVVHTCNPSPWESEAGR
jgi:hypothetical protein